MRSLRKRLRAKWAQHRTETAILAASFLGLVVNLACMGRLLSPGENPVIVLVDSQREAALLRFLNLTTMIPRCRVRVIRHTDELRAFAKISPGKGTLLVATARLYSKHYQGITGLRRRLQLIVL